MGLLNHIVGNKKDLAIELKKDEDERFELWKSHIRAYLKRSDLSKHFNYRNVDAAIADFDRTVEVLDKIAKLVSPDIVEIGEEIRIDKEALVDIRRLEYATQLKGMDSVFGQLKKKEKVFIGLFKEIYKVLLTELELIKHIKKKPKNLRELLLVLFEMIYHDEDRLYDIFAGKLDESKGMHSQVMQVVRSIFMQQKIEEKKLTAAERFAAELKHHMLNPDSAHKYRTLGIKILEKLAKIAGPTQTKDADEYMAWLKKLESFIDSDEILSGVIRKVSKKYTDEQVRMIMDVFREAFSYNFFEDMIGDLGGIE